MKIEPCCEESVAAAASRTRALSSASIDERRCFLLCQTRVCKTVDFIAVVVIVVIVVVVVFIETFRSFVHTFN